MATLQQTHKLTEIIKYFGNQKAFVVGTAILCWLLLAGEGGSRARGSGTRMKERASVFLSLLKVLEITSCLIRIFEEFRSWQYIIFSY